MTFCKTKTAQRLVGVSPRAICIQTGNLFAQQLNRRNAARPAPCLVSQRSVNHLTGEVTPRNRSSSGSSRTFGGLAPFNPTPSANGVNADSAPVHDSREATGNDAAEDRTGRRSRGRRTTERPVIERDHVLLRQYMVSLFFAKKWQDGRNAYPAIVFLCSCETLDATLRDANFG